MFNQIVSFVSGIIKPVTEVIDQVHTSTEEKLILKTEIAKVEALTLIKLNEFVLALTKAQAEVISAEMKYGNWLSKSWRPIAMLFFLVLIGLDTFDILAKPLNESVWLLLQIGLGGYIVGRSAEKVITNLKRDKQ